MKKCLSFNPVKCHFIHTAFISPSVVFIIQHLYTEHIAPPRDVDISNLHVSAFGHGICILTYAINWCITIVSLNEEYCQ